MHFLLKKCITYNICCTIAIRLCHGLAIKDCKRGLFSFSSNHNRQNRKTWGENMKTNGRKVVRNRLNSCEHSEGKINLRRNFTNLRRSFINLRRNFTNLRRKTKNTPERKHVFVRKKTTFHPNPWMFSSEPFFVSFKSRLSRLRIFLLKRVFTILINNKRA